MVQILAVLVDGLYIANTESTNLKLASLLWVWLCEMHKPDYNNTHMCRSAASFYELSSSRSDPSWHFIVT